MSDMTAIKARRCVRPVKIQRSTLARVSTLSRQALNRATSQRQLLLERSALTVPQVLERVAGMQAQNPNPPYFGLWTRIAGFTQQQLIDEVTARQAVRISLMRSTIHLVTAPDCLLLRPLLQPVHERGFAGNWGRNLAGADLAPVIAAGRRLVETEPMTFAVLGERLAALFPGLDGPSMAQAIRTHVPLVQVPPRGLWGSSGQARHTSAEHWLGQPLDPRASLETLFLRYLAGYGPASVKDAQTWSGLTRLGEVAARLRPRLRVYRDEAGVELFDLESAGLPDPSAPAPVRYLAEFDNLILSYADRSRIISDEHRQRILTPNGLFPGTFTVDGFVAGTWKLSAAKTTAALTVTPFHKLPKPALRELESEGYALLAFAAPTQSHTVTFAP
jgi:hypothetical protein